MSLSLRYAPTAPSQGENYKNLFHCNFALGVHNLEVMEFSRRCEFVFGAEDSNLDLQSFEISGTAATEIGIQAFPLRFASQM